MDRFTQAAMQLRDWYRGLTLGARLSAAGLLAVVLVGLVWMFAAAGDADQFLMNGESFSGGQLATMEAAFAQAGLTEYRIDRHRVRVPSGQHARYMAALADADALPPSFNDYLEKALAEDSVFSNRRDKETRMKIARQNELALIIRSMPNVEAASVLYDVKETRRGLDRREIVTASVSVKTAGEQPIDAKHVATIRNLVAGAIAGLEPENIAVADLSGRAYPGGDDGLEGSLSDPYYARKRMYEKNLERKIADSLVYVPGVVVQVNAELDPEIRQVQESIKPNSHTVPQRTRVQTSLEPMKAADRSARVAPPAGMRVPRALGPSSGSVSLDAPRQSLAPTPASRTVEEQTDSVVGYDRISSERRGLIPTSVRVTIVVPSRYYRQVWQQRRDEVLAGNQPTEPEQHELDHIEAEVTENIESAVLALLPTPENPLAQPRVCVTTFQSLVPPPPPIVEPRPVGFDAADWLTRNWRALAGGVLAVSVLLLAKVIFARASEPPASPAVVSFQSTGAMDEAPSLAASPQRPIVREDVASIVRNDPDAAASILRNWINKAG